MKILGIETSCDETAASIVENGQTILSNIVASSLKDHQKYGGIIPEIASRRQLELIQAVVGQALNEAGVGLDDIDAIAVTKNPGLLGSLLVGLSFARALAFALHKPLIEVNHIEAHLYANFLRFKTQEEKLPRLPAVGLVVSGGHSSLFYVKDFQQCWLLGQTRDDAAGEAYDKVARILNLGYPGGPIIDRLAKTGENNNIQFKCAELPKSFDFSFSGIKTAVLYYTQKHIQESLNIPQIAYAFQKSVVAVLVSKALYACQKKKVNQLLIGGGVAANSYLREKLIDDAAPLGITVHFPPLSLCLDNAAMVAGLGYRC